MIDCLYEPFKNWSGKGSVWLLSDTHFNDSDCKIMNPNWVTPDEQINILNKYITKNDTFVCLGDCGDLSYIKKIRSGHKVLIKGNHDDKGNSYYSEVFDEVYDGALFISNKILLSHEPVNGIPFALNIHGHVHNGEYEYIDCFCGKHLNIAADVINYIPINLGKLIKNGILSNIKTIHRITIDNAIARKDWEENGN